jgi:hypothetical protein
MLSEAQTLENILSVIGITDFLAGTKLHIWAIKIISAFCFKYVDFQPIFGQVIIFIKFFSSKKSSFGIKFFSIFSTTGCLQPTISKLYLEVISGFV